MKNISVHTKVSVSMPGVASAMGRLPRTHAAFERRAVTRTAGHEDRTTLPLPATVDAEIQKAYEALVSARRLRRYVERLISEHDRTPL